MYWIMRLTGSAEGFVLLQVILFCVGERISLHNPSVFLFQDQLSQIWKNWQIYEHMCYSMFQASSRALICVSGTREQSMEKPHWQLFFNKNVPNTNCTDVALALVPPITLGQRIETVSRKTTSFLWCAIRVYSVGSSLPTVRYCGTDKGGGQTTTWQLGAPLHSPYWILGVSVWSRRMTVETVCVRSPQLWSANFSSIPLAPICLDIATYAPQYGQTLGLTRYE